MRGQNVGNAQSWADTESRKGAWPAVHLCCPQWGSSESEEADRDNNMFYSSVKRTWRKEAVATLLVSQGFKNLSFPVTKASAMDDKVQIGLLLPRSHSPFFHSQKWAEPASPAAGGSVTKLCPCATSGSSSPHALPPILLLL